MNNIHHFLSTCFEYVSQSELADISGLRQATISNIWTGKTKRPHSDTKRKIMKAVKIIKNSFD